jgi:hypothetical protein
LENGSPLLIREIVLLEISGRCVNSASGAKGL